MQQSTFEILLHLKTVSGFEKFGKFYIGHDRHFAYALFKKLNGRTDLDIHTILYLELMESKNGLPLNVEVLACTLEQLAENCSTITKEIFKFNNLEEIK
jgi:hypothetical protein